MEVIRGGKGQRRGKECATERMSGGKGRPIAERDGKRGGKGRGEMKESQGKLREKDRLGRNRLRPD